MLIYDIEIANAIQGRKEPRLANVKYCNGWEDHKGMGISVVGVYDYAESRYRVFTESNKNSFLDLVSKHDLLIGFNNVRFDNKVISACWGLDIPQNRCYDALAAIWAALGLSDVFDYRTHGGYSLGACAAANFGLSKSADGGQAPIDWQSGKIGDVIDYCLNDVYLTKLLVDRIIEDGQIVSPKDKTKVLTIQKPNCVAKQKTFSF